MRKIFKKYLTVAEERQLFKVLQAHSSDLLAQRDLLWMRLMRNKGIRVEAMSLFTVWDAREALRTGRLMLRAEIQKGGRAHELGTDKKTREILRGLLVVRRSMGFTEGPDDPLILGRRGRGLSVRSYQDRMRYWCKKANLTVEASPHWLRHTLAKRVMDTSTAEDPRGVAMGLLGHSSISSTAIYTMPDRETVDEIGAEVAV